MPFRLCILFIFISFGLYAQDYYIELDKEDTLIWEAQYPLNLCVMNMDSETITRTDFIYNPVEAPFIISNEIPVPDVSSNRWGTGVLYNNDQVLGLTGLWGSPRKPLYIINTVSYKDKQAGIFSSLDWISDDRFSMSYSMIFNELWGIKNQWDYSYKRNLFQVQSNLYENREGQLNGYLAMDMCFGLEWMDLDFEGYWDSMQDSKDLFFTLRYNRDRNTQMGLKLGSTFSDKLYFNSAVMVSYSGSWELGMDGGYMRAVVPSMIFDDTDISISDNQWIQEPLPFAHVEIKKVFSSLYFESNFVWKSIPGKAVLDNTGGFLSFTLPEGVIAGNAIGITTQFAYNNDLVQPDNLSASSGYSGIVSLNFPLGDRLNFNSNLTMNQNGIYRSSFMFLWGGSYVGDV